LHCYLGIHVLERGVIFVDLALAQIARSARRLRFSPVTSLGLHSPICCPCSSRWSARQSFSVARFRDERIPQEAIIGITYAVASSVAILVLDRSPHGQEELESMLVGSILYVTWADVYKTAAIYAAIGALHYAFRDRFVLISQDPEAAIARGWSIRGWDFLFYVTFGVVVSISVRVAGSSSRLQLSRRADGLRDALRDRVRTRLLLGWLIGFIASVVGLYLSLQFDLPTGASVVATFGGVLILCALMYAVTRGGRR
jgi:zinc/manganese transport system permease protein